MDEHARQLTIFKIILMQEFFTAIDMPAAVKTLAGKASLTKARYEMTGSVFLLSSEVGLLKVCVDPTPGQYGLEELHYLVTSAGTDQRLAAHRLKVGLGAEVVTNPA